MCEKFWIVWSPEGKFSPKYEHDTKLAAEKEATRLAQTKPGIEFFSLEVTGRAIRKSGDDLARFQEAIEP